jgi:hypothetical protein
MSRKRKITPGPAYSLWSYSATVFLIRSGPVSELPTGLSPPPDAGIPSQGYIPPRREWVGQVDAPGGDRGRLGAEP